MFLFSLFRISVDAWRPCVERVCGLGLTGFKGLSSSVRQVASCLSLDWVERSAVV